MHPALKNALAEYGTLASELQSAARTETQQGRRELIALRRKLIEAFTDLGRLAQSAIDTSGRPDAEALTEELRHRLATARRDIASHQTRWPAVAIDHQSREYRDSARTASNSNKLMIEWIEANLIAGSRSAGR